MKLGRLKKQNYEVDVKINFDVALEEQRKRAEDLLLLSEDIKQIVKFSAEVEGANIEKMEKGLLRIVEKGSISNNDLKHILVFAKEVISADLQNIAKMTIKFMEMGFIDNENFEVVCELANLLDEKNLHAIENAVIRMNSYPYLVNFVKSVEGVNLKKFERAVIVRKGEQEILDFKQNILKSIEMKEKEKDR